MAAGQKRLQESIAAAARALAGKRSVNAEPAPARAKVKPVVEVEPTPELRQTGQFDLDDVVDKRPGGTNVTIGKAYRRRPMIETLGDRGVFNDAELKALRHYRHHADIADRSPLRDSLNKQRGGSGTGPTVEILNAVRVRDDCERAAGSLADILRAVVVYDWSLSQWAMARHGSIEVQRTDRRTIQIQPTKRGLAIAHMEVQMAAKRVEAELSA